MKRRTFISMPLFGFFSCSVIARPTETKPVKETPYALPTVFFELLSIFDSPQEAASLGQLYLKNNNFLRDHMTLLSAMGINEKFPHDPISLFEKRRAHDYQFGNTVILDGWVLSAAEVSLCCAATLCVSNA